MGVVQIVITLHLDPEIQNETKEKNTKNYIQF